MSLATLDLLDNHDFVEFYFSANLFKKKIIYLYIVCVFYIVSEKVNWISLGESHRLVIVDFWGFHWMTHKNRIFIIIIKIRNFRENSNFILIIICLHFFLSLGIASECLNSNVIIIHIHTYLIIFFFWEKVPTWNWSRRSFSFCFLFALSIFDIHNSSHHFYDIFNWFNCTYIPPVHLFIEILHRKTLNENNKE